MKHFECQHCGAPLYFEASRCASCGRDVGYVPERQTLTALEASNGVWRSLATPRLRYRYCANAAHGVCNWLVAADQQDQLCLACRHNRTIPDLSLAGNAEGWRKIEIAKHRLFYTLLRLGLPHATRAEDEDGLAFDFIADVTTPSGHIPVMTGHDNGLITINLAEADDVERERQRSLMGEPYRTLLGHFRHEIAHYYWGRLVANPTTVDEFRQVFGDERQDYGAALQAHYANGPPADWPERFVTAYASSHPWEDFAETWAHYFHMVDTLETAGAFRMSVRPRSVKGKARLTANIDFDPHEASIERLIEAWLPLTFAMNSINRSMGLPDLYPFVLSPEVILKITFIHMRIHANQTPVASTALPAMIAGLKAGLLPPSD
jgi:hypothetical protein